MYSKIFDYLTHLIIISLAAVSTCPSNFLVRVLMLFVAFILFGVHDELAKNRDKNTNL